MSIHKEISKAKIAIMAKPETVFLSSVCCSLAIVINENIPTAATDGKDIQINPKFWTGLTKEEQAFLLAHETMHVVYMHMVRNKSRDPKIFNYAADYVINYELAKQHFSLIEGALYDEDYADMSSEQIYELLLKDSKGLPNNVLDGDITYENLTKEDIQSINDILINAATTAVLRNQANSVPSSVRQYLNELSKPKVNWKVVLRRFMQDLDNQNYTWKRPNKRYLPTNQYLPSLYDTNLTKLSFAIDTSGSVAESTLNYFINEIAMVMKHMKPKELELIQFDHELQSVDKVTNLYDLKHIQFTGFGGTDPQVVLEHFKSKSSSKALIIITDGEFHIEELTNPKKPVIWVVFSTEEFTPPFGQCIQIKENLYGNAY